MEFNLGGYFRQTIYAFNKLSELSFDKEKPHNASLIAGIRAILITLEYDMELKVDIITAIFQIRILLKRSRLFTSEYTNQQLLQKVQSSTKERDVKKSSSSPIQFFFNVFKRRSSVTSHTSDQSLPLELDVNIRKSKSQYQILKTRKLSFEASDLSKHLIKNLQPTINVLTDKEDNEEEEGDIEEIFKPSSQK